MTAIETKQKRNVDERRVLIFGQLHIHIFGFKASEFSNKGYLMSIFIVYVPLEIIKFWHLLFKRKSTFVLEIVRSVLIYE